MTSRSTSPRRRKAAESIKRRIRADTAGAVGLRCGAPGCKRPVAKATGGALSEGWCRYHLDHRSRHGSTWAKTISGPVLQARLAASQEWLRGRKDDPHVQAARRGLAELLEGAGVAERVPDLALQDPATKARAALARYRETGRGGEALLTRCLAVLAVVRDPHRVGVDTGADFLRVQIAKAVNRLVPAAEAVRVRGGRLERYKAWAPSRGRYLWHMGSMILAPVWEALGAAMVDQIISLEAERRGRRRTTGRPSAAEQHRRQAAAAQEGLQKALAKVRRGRQAEPRR